MSKHGRCPVPRGPGGFIHRQVPDCRSGGCGFESRRPRCL